jgi:hypothetical protein
LARQFVRLRPKERYGQPAVVLLDPDGQEVARVVSPRDAGTLRALMPPLLDLARAQRRRLDAYAATVGPVTDDHRRTVSALIERFDDDALEARDAATHALRAIGHPARVVLSEHRGGSAEVRARVAHVLAELLDWEERLR